MLTMNLMPKCYKLQNADIVYVLSGCTGILKLARMIMIMYLVVIFYDVITIFYDIITIFYDLLVSRATTYTVRCKHFGS